MSLQFKSRLFSVVCLFLVMFLGSPFFGGAVYAQSNRDVLNRISRIENEINTLSRTVYRGETPPPGAAGLSGADIEVRLQQLEHEIRDIRGSMEQQSYDVRQLTQKFDRIAGDLALRVQDLERKVPGGVRNLSSANNYTSQPPMDTPPQQNAIGLRHIDLTHKDIDGKAPPDLSNTFSTIKSASPSDPAAGMYESAFSALKNAKYDQAEAEFKKFLITYPNHVLAGNAQYWMGETFYVRGDYEKAARVFAEGFQKYPEGSKAADNLLKLGMSLAGMGNTSDACVALQQLEKQFTSGAGPVLRRAHQEMKRLKCPS